MFKFLICLFSLLVLIACGTKPVVKDPAPAAIDMGHKRVETSICGRWSVGENGCVFPQGAISGSLKIYKVLSGQVSIIGQGCSVDYSLNYAKDEEEWITIDLKSLIGTKRLADDCVLTIFQFPNIPGGNDAEFPLRGMTGTVILGSCPEGTKCSFSNEQKRHGSNIALWSPTVAQSGEYLVRGCGQEMVPASPYSGSIAIDLREKWPGGFPVDGKDGCTFIMSVKGSDGSKQKIYRRVWLYKKDTILVSAPALIGTKIQADQYVSLSIIDGKPIVDNVASYEPIESGNMFRFYTAQGRSLVVKVKGGKIEWTQ